MTGHSTQEATPRPLRRDAAHNRERLLAAARELFAEQGLGVTLNDIAYHAGVGVGTAYRRFANKEEVIDALFEERLCAVEDAAREALREPDPWLALSGYLEHTLQLQFGDRGLSQILNDPTLGDERVGDVRRRIAPLTVELVRRAREAGVVRDDFAPTDVIFIQAALSPIIETTRGIAPELYRRYLAMVLDGVRASAATQEPLPIAALDSATTHRAMTTNRRSRPAR